MELPPNFCLPRSFVFARKDKATCLSVQYLKQMTFSIRGAAKDMPQAKCSERLTKWRIGRGLSPAEQDTRAAAVIRGEDTRGCGLSPDEEVAVAAPMLLPLLLDRIC